MKSDLPDLKLIVAIFLVLGFVWVFISGELLYSVADPANYLNFELFKGLLFVVLTAAFLYFLLLYHQRKVKEALGELERSEASFKKLYEDSPQPMWIHCEGRGILYMNKAAIRLFGHQPEQLLSMPEESFSVASAYSQERSQETAGEGGWEGVRSFVSQKGELLYLDLVVQLIDYEHKSARLVIANDVSRLVKAEKERGQVLNELVHYKKALDRSALLSVTDVNGVILDVNNKFCEVSGFSREELIGNTYQLINSNYHFPDIQKKDGQVWRGEISAQAKDGNLFWVDLSVVPVLNEFNQVYKYMAISYPVTDRKLAELRSEKVHQELMTFMYKASHNLRGPVATLSGLLNVAAIEVKDPSSLHYIEMLNERTRHLEFVLNELIAITKIKQEELSMSPVSFQSVVKQVCGMFEEDIEKHKICLECRFQIDQLFTNDEKLIRSLLFYLLDNSIKFRNNRAPRVQIDVQEKPNGVVLSVKDNGPGISAAVRDRIYEMYFRGHEKSGGSGLGLYIVNSIVERLSGYIHLQSQEGEGCTFTVFLPDARYLQEQPMGNTHFYLRDRKAKRAPKTEAGS